MVSLDEAGGLLAGRGLDVDRRDDMLVFPATPAGFEVALSTDGEEWTVWFDAWHAHFEELEPAVKLFELGATGRARLRVWSRGGTDYRWAVEIHDDGGWRQGDLMGGLLFPFWRRKAERVLCNCSAPPRSTGTPAVPPGGGTG